MKLRSGKMLKSRVDTLPKKLEDELEADLENFKTLFSGNLQHAKELLNLISTCRYTDHRVLVSEKVGEGYDLNKPVETTKFLRAAGELMRLVIGSSSFYRENNIEPEYYDIMRTKVKNFDLEIPILGNIEENNMGLE
ncbi:MAG: hypothetical protein JHC33_10380 [Ignisphaera sp.]|nr:hypothetical protein [Ignisphaera sp.]